MEINCHVEPNLTLKYGTKVRVTRDGSIGYITCGEFMIEDIEVYGISPTPESPTTEYFTLDALEEISETTNEEPCEDLVNHPKHYNSGKYEVIDIIEDATNGLNGINAVCLGNVLKYVLRFQHKNGVQDLEKARWYLDKLIKTYNEVD